MDMIEVDPKLFVTCRLCLEDMGVYQIVPQVQEQIKYCFDIDVKLFDGLPQLICKSCKSILNEYLKIKKTFIEKQIALKCRMEGKQEEDTKLKEQPQQNQIKINSSVQQSEDECQIVQQKAIQRVKKRRPRRISSSTSEDNGDTNDTHILNRKRKKKINKKKSCVTWDIHYKKRFVCRLCQKSCRNRGNLMHHLVKHETLFSKYRDILKTHCTVQMIKFDDKPNLTGMTNAVVYSHDKILCDQNKMEYHIIYTPKEVNNRFSSPDRWKSNIDEIEKNNSSDEDIRYIHRKRAVLHTRSSNETVILEKDNSKNCMSSDGEEKICKTENGQLEPNVTECIHIDDSSDSASYRSNADLRIKPVKASLVDYKKIQNIISVCHNRYIKKIENYENGSNKYSAHTESQLKHKILSTGRKVINKQGLSCTGLLRFMEYKNLEIKWIPATVNSNKEVNYVRIMPKLKDKERHLSDNSVWKNISEIQENELVTQQLNATKVVNTNIAKDESAVIRVISPALGGSGPTNDHSKENKPLTVNQALLYPSDNDSSLRNKLLNESPVANPKQLPKKINIVDTKLSVESISLTNQNDNYESSTNFIKGDPSGTDLCMPIITFTTSLAPSVENKRSQQGPQSVSNNNVATVESEKTVPRIKVKPVTELMSERVLKNLSQRQVTTSNDVWNQTHVNSNTANLLDMPNIDLNSLSNSSQSLIPSSSSMGPMGALSREYVVLDTVQLPNTRTDSPYQYFKKLLQMHNMFLLDINEILTNDFKCLIKFKVVFKQDTQQPQILCLSFFCSHNKFYLGIKHDSLGTDIDLNKFPANWQLEILNKIYKEEVANKVLKNAQKISPTVYEYTRNFLCLLKSIELKTVM